MSLDPTQLRPAAGSSGEATGAATVVRTRIGPVELGRQLGAGGMASVFEGLDRGFTPPRRVAIKLMDPALSGETEFRQRFEREASLVGDFRHHNIVRVFASGETADGLKYIVMEYLAGGSLADRLATGPLGTSESLAIASAMADALAYSHAQGVVHRDFKPGNILITAEGQPVLSDFGVAKVRTTSEAGLTRHAVSIGAPRYMSPEQERAEEVTDHADLYALGVTLMEMLTYQPVPARLRALRGMASVKELGALLPADTPAGIAALLARCLQYDPADRPTAAEARKILETARNAAATSPAAASGRSRTVRPAALWGIGALVVAGLASAAYMMRRPETAPAPVAAQGKAPEVPAPAVATTNAAVEPAVTAATQPAVEAPPAAAPSVVNATPASSNASGSAVVDPPRTERNTRPVVQSRVEQGAGAAIVSPAPAAATPAAINAPNTALVATQEASTPPPPAADQESVAQVAKKPDAPAEVAKTDPAKTEPAKTDADKSNAKKPAARKPGYVPPAF